MEIRLPYRRRPRIRRRRHCINFVRRFEWCYAATVRMSSPRLRPATASLLAQTRASCFRTRAAWIRLNTRSCAGSSVSAAQCLGSSAGAASCIFVASHYHGPMHHRIKFSATPSASGRRHWRMPSGGEHRATSHGAYARPRSAIQFRRGLSGHNAAFAKYAAFNRYTCTLKFVVTSRKERTGNPFNRYTLASTKTSPSSANSPHFVAYPRGKSHFSRACLAASS